LGLHLERHLEFAYGQARCRRRIRIAFLANIRERRARQLVDAPHQRFH
jgi:hypothetical protein